MDEYERKREFLRSEIARRERRVVEDADHVVREMLTGVGTDAARRTLAKTALELDIDRRVLEAVDRVEAEHRAAADKADNDHADWLTALRTDRVPAELLRDNTEKALGKLRRRVDVQGYFNGIDRARINEHVGRELRGLVDDETLSLLRCAATTKQDISYFKFEARDFLRGQGEM